MAKKLRSHWALLLTAALTLVGLCYVMACGQGIYVQVGDNLDSNLPWFTMLRDNHLFFAQDAKVPFLGGIDRDYLPSEWNFYSLLYWLLPAFPAYILGNVLKIALSVAGWAAVGRLAFGRERHAQNLMILGGFVYANLPVWPPLSLGFGALPLGLALLWQIYRAPRPWHFAALVAFAATSDFSTLGIFCCGFLLLFFLLDWAYHRRPAWRMLSALAMLALSFVVLEYRLFGIMLFGSEPSLRQEMTPQFEALRSVPARAWDAFWQGDGFAGTLQKYLVAPVCCLYFVWQNILFLRRRAWRCLLTDPFNLLMAWAVFSALLSAVQNTVYFQAVLSAVLPLLTGFNFSRGVWVSALVFYLAFYLILVRLARRCPALSYLLAAASFAVLLLCPGTYNDIQRNLACQAERLTTGACETLNWREFYAADLFNEIKEDVGYDGEWSAAFGLHPGILEQNGIATLDGYLSYYPLAYKRAFRRLIEPGLRPGSYYQIYFDTWGGRAYLFAEGVPYGPLRRMPEQEVELPIDAGAFREMGGRYIFSRLRLTNAAALGLTEFGPYTDAETPYTLYLYRAD